MMSLMSEGAPAAAQYDAMATEYSADNDDGVFNALYERPAMIRMLGDVQGLRVLDVGCGAGQLSSALIDAGATGTGIDVSAGMIALAMNRLGSAGSFEVADLNDPLSFDDGSFDLVVASLVLHYLGDIVGRDDRVVDDLTGGSDVGGSAVERRHRLVPGLAIPPCNGLLGSRSERAVGFWAVA